MAAVMVRPGSSGLSTRGPDPSRPPAIAATMVSPIAREVAMMNAATIPDTAAGSTTRTVVVLFRAPTPKLASRRDIGTARRASSQMDAMIGTTRTPMAMPATSMLRG